MTESSDKRTLLLKFGSPSNPKIEQEIQEMAQHFQKILPELSIGSAVLFARGLMAKEDVFNALDITQKQAFVGTAIECVKEFGVAEALPALQKMLDKIAEDDRPTN